MSKRKIRSSQITEHHIIPVSRSANGRIPKDKSNVLKVDARAHESWHLLFGNATPSDAILIIRKFWSASSPDEDLSIDRNCIGYYQPE
jgi:hypothetical protein